MEPPVPDSSDAPTVAAGDTHTSRSFGHFHLLQKVGEGGMGEVWLAEQTYPVHRQVALKIIKAGMDTAQVVGRFEAERQALALMDHPAIAVVFDGGVTPEGRPFFAMEYVKGEPITAYCDRNKLGTRERLELFVLVCEGVQHAHQKGVIHRDLKPSNVLVTIQDGKAVPKIIDFGVAKATTQQLTQRTLFTEVGTLIGTLEYMSPEQAELTGLDVDTRTDVYALGVLLYELLTGTLPFDRQTLRERGLDEMRRTIREVEPPRPSTRITELGPACSEAARNRDTEPGRLASQLKGDLDWITMKALEKNRTRRYVTVAGLADDIGRHLCNQPVAAGPPSQMYRARKFVRRHRVGVASVATLLVFAAGFSVTLAVQAQRLATERDRAETAQKKAEQVSDFLTGLFRAGDPNESLGDTVTARQLLERGVQSADLLAGEPELQAHLLDTIGLVYQGLGAYDRAQSVTERALTLRRDALGPAHADVAASHRHLGAVLRDLGRLAEAETELREALAIDRKTPAVSSLAVAADLHELAHTLSERGALTEGDAMFNEALAIRRSVPEADPADVADSLSGLAYVRSKAGHPREAVGFYREALDVLVKHLNPRHPQVARGHQNLGVALSDMGEYDEAATHMDIALNAYRQVYGQAHPSIAIVLNNIANLQLRRGDLAAAERLFGESAAMREALLGPEHPATTRALQNRAVALIRLNRLEESETVFRELVERSRARLGDSNPEVATLVSNLAEVLRRRGKLAEAERRSREAVAVLTAGTSEPTLEAASGLIGLGRILTDLRRFEEAEPLLQQALAVRRERLGDDHPDVARTREYLETLYTRWPEGRPR